MTLDRSVVGDSRFANPNKAADEDASRDSTLDNPLLPGKKDVSDSVPQEWGSLRYGIPKGDEAFGLPKQELPGSKSNYDPNGNDADAGGSVETNQTDFAK